MADEVHGDVVDKHILLQRLDHQRATVAHVAHDAGHVHPRVRLSQVRTEVVRNTGHIDTRLCLLQEQTEVGMLG